jgi:hypothetical protein
MATAELLGRIGENISETNVDLAQLLGCGLIGADDVEDGLLDGLREFDVVELEDLEMERVIWGLLGEVAEDTVHGVHGSAGIQTEDSERKALAGNVSVRGRHFVRNVRYVRTTLLQC